MKKQTVIAALALLIALVVSCGNDSPAKSGPPRKIDLAGLRAKCEFSGKIAFQSDLGGHNEIYVLTKDGLRKLTETAWSNEYPKWSPDGKRISFMANPGGKFQIFVASEDGSGLTQVSHSAQEAIEEAWFPDGKKIAYTEQRRKGLGKSFTLYSLDLETKAEAKLLPDFKNSSSLPEFSPTAPLMAFTGKKMMGWGVFIHDFSINTTRVLTEGGGACRPHFSPDGRRIAFVSSAADGKGDIWLINPDGSGKERLTDLPETYDYFPSWSPDGRYIVFASGTKHYPYQGEWSLAIVEVATKKIVPLFSSGARDVFPDWH
jgi:Tol biopolymer transport system component